MAENLDKDPVLKSRLRSYERNKLKTRDLLKVNKKISSSISPLKESENKSRDYERNRNSRKNEVSPGEIRGYEKSKTLESSIEDPEKLKSGKRRMKWKDYLQIQVEKQRKINDLMQMIANNSVRIRKKPKHNKRSMIGKKKDSGLNKTVEHQRTETFKKLDEQEGFIEENEDACIIDACSLTQPIKKIKEPDFYEAQPRPHPPSPSNSLKRLQLIIEKYQSLKNSLKPTAPLQPKAPLQPLFSKSRPKSSFSRYSTTSQQEAVLKLQHLKDEEQKIKLQKEEIIKFLESKSQSKDPSRPMTVNTLQSRAVKPPATNFPLRSAFPDLSKPPKRSCEPFPQPSNKLSSDSEVKALISNLF